MTKEETGRAVVRKVLFKPSLVLLVYAREKRANLGESPERSAYKIASNRFQGKYYNQLYY